MNKLSCAKISIVILSLITIILLASCLYFYKESKNLDDSMSIGTPIKSDQINYSEVISNKDDFRTIQLALINGISIDKPIISDNIPTAIVKIDDFDQGICFLFADVWFDNNKVIFGLGGNKINDVKYKEISGDFAKTVIECISKYIVK
ncbi:hypothetical protein UMC2_37141 [[Clostridium] sordellii]|uniref:hypothetical protein n=1 Tax=Paraclostridium sordellii TaxID=1505 RepID=UPI000543B3C4|nr:hypothetical protein [Paeniclostridium sordellii]CEK34503.1 hypothetical protein UMC2_37141 [[Clostridium] sordellii] [Paeniclostridium sordellii]